MLFVLPSPERLHGGQIYRGVVPSELCLNAAEIVTELLQEFPDHFYSPKLPLGNGEWLGLGGIRKAWFHRETEPPIDRPQLDPKNPLVGELNDLASDLDEAFGRSAGDRAVMIYQPGAFMPAHKDPGEIVRLVNLAGSSRFTTYDSAWNEKSRVEQEPGDVTISFGDVSHRVDNIGSEPRIVLAQLT